MGNTRCITRIHHIKLRVRDIEQSAAFYRNLFGFDEEAESCGGATRECMMRDEAGGRGFGIVLSQCSQQEVVPNTLDHICFEVPTYADVVRLYERARQAEAQATAPRLYERHWQTFIFDPDGHKIEILTQDRGPNGVCEKVNPHQVVT